MRLSALASLLPVGLVSSLEAIGINTDIDLLFGPSDLEILRRLPPQTTSLKELRKSISLVAECSSPKGASAFQLLQEACPYRNLESHCLELDSILEGGFRSSYVFEVSGDRRSGKSTLLLNVALHSLVDDPEAEAVWIDTTGDFSPDRAAQVLECFSADKPKIGVLERLQVALAVDIETVQRVMQVIISRLKPRARCIVIDSITPLLGPYLSSTSTQGHAIMTSFMRHLRSIARTYSLVIFVINNATGILGSQPNPQSIFPDTVKKPALGVSFPYLTDATLWLTAIGSGGIYRIEVLRSRISRTNAWCEFVMTHGILLPDKVVRDRVGE
ncbi:dna repair protein rad51-like 4 [Moniliophthora roreri MCA 2997]|uniref:Dna repair protein rad51-like 4 n=1 Tax=Moniliophthora roreri (strain MCA 2997) TaxID=1381753 RepID=V2YRC4_MONRO|nr:dna repair protein rad51-like 4 [Moniliophthora roreri MCA 2997]